MHKIFAPQTSLGYSINVNSVCSEAVWLFYQCQFSVRWACLVILSMSIQCAVKLFGYSISVNSVCSEAVWLFYQCQFSVQWSCLVILSVSIQCAVRLFGYSINVNSVCSEAVWLSTYVLTQVVMLSSLSDELILLLSFKVNVTDASCFSGFPISSQTINVSSSSTGRHFTSPSWQQDKYSVEDHILIQHKGSNLPTPPHPTTTTPPNHHHPTQPPPPHPTTTTQPNHHHHMHTLW